MNAVTPFVRPKAAPASTFRRIERKTVFVRHKRPVLVEIIRKAGTKRADWTELIRKASQGL